MGWMLPPLSWYRERERGVSCQISSGPSERVECAPMVGPRQLGCRPRFRPRRSNSALRPFSRSRQIGKLQLGAEAAPHTADHGKKAQRGKGRSDRWITHRR
jgi:hypothetical protein